MIILICPQHKLTDQWTSFIPNLFIHNEFNEELYKRLIIRQRSMIVHKILETIYIIIDVDANVSIPTDAMSLYGIKCIYCDVQNDLPHDATDVTPHQSMIKYANISIDHSIYRNKESQ